MSALVVAVIAFVIAVAALVHVIRTERWLRAVQRASGDPVALDRLLRKRR